MSSSRLARFATRPPPWLTGVLLLGGCLDYGLFKPDPDEEGGPGTEEPDPDPYTLPESDSSLCGPPSVDTEVAVNEDCLRGTEPGLVDPILEWVVDGFSNMAEYDQVLMAPVVGILFDDNDDGHLDLSDVPSVVIVTDDAHDGGGTHGVIRVLDGRDGSNQLNIIRVDLDERQIYPYRYSNVALGDVDADGQPEIVVLVDIVTSGGGGGGGEDTASGGGGGGGGGSDDNPILPKGALPTPTLRCAVAAFDTLGNLEWLADTAMLDCAGHAPSIADLDADGRPEVVLGKTILDGESGALQAQGLYDEGRSYVYAEIGMHSVVSDLDGDGSQEILAGRSVYRPDGSQVCQAAAPADGFTAAADFDLDGQGEFVVVGAGTVSVVDTDCTVLATWSLGDAGNGGPPAVGDLDQDGRPEIGLCSATTYQVFRADGTLLWSQPVADTSSHATGSLFFDFAHDGLPEVVYADEQALYIFDGATGELRYSDERHHSRTLHDYPTVADVDRDGQVEIIVPNGGGHDGTEQRGIYVLGSQSRSWQAGRMVWNQHAYSLTNVGDDLSIPALPDPNWPQHNSFRSGDPNPSNGAAWPDAVPVARVCTEECADGFVVLDIALANLGAAPLRSGVPVYAWTVNEAGLPRVLQVEWLDTVTAEGTVSTALRLRLDAEDLETATLYVAADLDPEGLGYADECDEDNNVLTVTEARCP